MAAGGTPGEAHGQREKARHRPTSGRIRAGTVTAGAHGGRARRPPLPEESTAPPAARVAAWNHVQGPSSLTHRACLPGYDPFVIELPRTSSLPVVRADFSDDHVWQQLQEEILSLTEEGWGAAVEFVEDPALSGLSEEAIVAGYARGYPIQYRHPVLFVVDHVAIAAPEHPLLVVNLNARDAGEKAKPFRTLPRQVQGIENNLSLQNMDFFDFARSANEDGVFRGF
jgi:hypothetical protein